MSFEIDEFEQFVNNSGLADVLAGKMTNGNAELEAAKHEIQHQQMRRQEERTAYEQEIAKLRAAAPSSSQQSTSSTNFENDAQSTQLANAIAALSNVIQTQSQLFSELRENVPTSSQAG